MKYLRREYRREKQLGSIEILGREFAGTGSWLGSPELSSSKPARSLVTSAMQLIPHDVTRVENRLAVWLRCDVRAGGPMGIFEGTERNLGFSFRSG